MRSDSLQPDSQAVLAGCDVFSRLSPRLIESLRGCMQERHYEAGVTMIRQGEAGDCLYLIVSGVARADVHDRKGVHSVGEFGRGDVVGEMALLTREPRIADVVAQTEVDALLLSASHFDQLARAHPELGVVMTNLLAARLGRQDRDGLGGKAFNGYRILRRLGRGGMSVVYEAEAIDTGCKVALKMMSHSLLYTPGAPTRFRQEAEMIETLRHDNIARLHEHFPAYGTQFLVMEKVDGPTLHELIRHHGHLYDDAARRILGQLAKALRFVHGRGIFHRDLKPGNVMVDARGVVKLMDFGLAKQDPALGDHTQTVSQMILGTPMYMAPEQLAGETTDARADLYGLACIGYEMLAGKAPFQQGNVLQLVQDKLRFTLPPAEAIARGGVADDLYRFLSAGLQNDPDDRDVSLDEIAEWAAPVDRALFADCFWRR